MTLLTKSTLADYLSKRLGSPVEIGELTTLSGGYSRVMTRFTAMVDGEARDYIARSDPPPEQSTVRTDRDDEWALLASLANSDVPAPAALFYDDTGVELGAKTIILEYAQGESFVGYLRKQSERNLESDADALCDLLVAIHAIDPALLPSAMERPTDWNSYIDSVIATWREAEAEHVESDPFLRYMATWLDQNRPAPAPLTFVHGEFQTSNVVRTSNGELLAVDWEFGHFGDPREDLGWCKWVGSAVLPPDLIGLDEERFCRRYCEKTGLGEDVVNPETVAYFSIFAAIGPTREVLRGQSAYAEGRSSSMRSAYVTSSNLSKHESWLRTVRTLSGARQVHKIAGPS